MARGKHDDNRPIVPGKSVDGRRAAEAIGSGEAPEGLVVAGKLTLPATAKLPDLLSAGWLELKDCTDSTRLPSKLSVSKLTLAGDFDPSRLLEGLSCFELELKSTRLTSLPPTLKVKNRLDLEGCTRLRSLPDGLSVGSLVLRGCSSLKRLPENLETFFLDISGCNEISEWPERGSVSVGRLAMRGCVQMRTVPPWLKSIAQLDLRDCVNISSLPEGIEVSSWVDLAGTRIRSLPKSLRGVQIRWRGVVVDERVAFRPEEITAAEILAERNAEKRRVLLERMGYETFLSQAKAQTLDRDADRGGPRRLVRVQMEDDEDLVCVSVICPSTQRQYVIRVPPTMQSCRQAVAWTAGFDNPDDYQPLAET